MDKSSAQPAAASNRSGASQPYDVAIVGGGLSAGLVALALLARRPQTRLAIVERGPRLAGNHTWCVHEDGLPADSRALLEPLVVHRWAEHEVRFPRRRRVLRSPYVCVTAERLNERVQAVVRAAPHAELQLGAEAMEVAPRSLRLADGRVLSAQVVLDGRGPRLGLNEAAFGYQKFLGLELRLARAHAFRAPLLMDATGVQQDGLRFFYLLPLAADRVLVEDTCFSVRPELDRERYRARALAYAARQGLLVDAVTREEMGVLPMPMQEQSDPPRAAAAQIGYAGGFFHPATGYSLPIALRVALALAEALPREAERALAALRRSYADQARFARRLNALLFRCFPDDAMRNVFERFFGLPEALINRFYRLEMTRADRARILLGRPPEGISLRKALALIGGVS
ncbi:MAG: lycopene beta-cyclase CrtY [Proteobacteria bacterium]|nr:lycopene beta-cyclase CrtY [Pseudomonadota bacterium]